MAPTAMRFNMIAFAVLSVVVLSSISWSGTDAVYRLQDDSKPLYYRLHLEPNIMENYFNGSVIIDFTVVITSSLLVLNQQNLMIDKVEIDGIPIRKWDADNDKEVLIIYCESDLIEGRTYRVTIKYSGELNEFASGFYKTHYTMGQETNFSDENCLLDRNFLEKDKIYVCRYVRQ